MKKIISLLLATVVGFSLIACSNATKDTGSNEDNGGATKTYTIAVAEAQANDETVIRREYLQNYIAPKYNVRFIFSEALRDADAQLSFIENAAAAGANSVIDFALQNPAQMAQVAKNYNMTYLVNGVRGGMAKDLFDEDPDNFFGGVGANQVHMGEMFGDYIKRTASEDGSEGFIIASIIASRGNEQHALITKAALNAIKDLYGLTFDKSVDELAIVDRPTEVANDKGINIFIYPGSTAQDTWLPGISAALQTGKYGYFVSAAASYTSTAVVVDEVERSFDKDIRVISVGSLGRSLTTAFNTKDKFGNPSTNMVTVKSVSAITGAMFAMAYNSLTGYGENMNEADGRSSLITSNQIGVESPEDLAILNEWDNTDTGKWIADYDFIDSLLGVKNPNIDAATMQKSLDSIDFESIRNRSK